MAVSVATCNADLAAAELLKHDTQPPTRRLIEPNGLRTRIRGLVAFWETVTSSRTNAALESSRIDAKQLPRSNAAPRDIYRPYGSHITHIAAPPSYEESIHDLPPDYTATDSFATVQCLTNADIATDRFCERTPRVTRFVPTLDARDVKVDFFRADHIRTHANKKAKKAAKQAQMSKWADSDNEDKKDDGDGGAGGEENNGGGGSGGNGGAGGDAPGGGGDGGDDGGDDWWDTGKKSKKDKKKKNAWDDFDEEEEEEKKKKKEEEEAKKS